METDVRNNPALLKLDLYCRGAHLDDSLNVTDEGGRPILRTRAGLGSGLEVVLPHGLWTNVPVTEDFVKDSPYVVRRRADGAIWIDRGSEPIAPVTLAPRPQWYDALTTTGKCMSAVGTLQGTYLGVYPARVCEYWLDKPKRTNCKFCSVGLNLGVDDANEKSVREVVEVAVAAREQSNITYIDFNTGHYEGDTYLDILEPYIRGVKEATGCLIGVQTPPHHDLSRYEKLKAMGVNRVSFCFEIFDPERFVEVCPGKAERYGLKRYLDAVAHCATLGRTGGFRFDPWVSNGEIIAGLEPPESSIRAIEWITGAGAIPTVCVFRPLRGTDYEDVRPPRTEDVLPVFAAQYEAAMRHDLPILVAPNVNVSLVLLPWESRWLVSRRVRRRYALKEAKMAAMRAVFSRVFLGNLARKDERRRREGLSLRAASA
ncbi:MAG: hypothetical protein HC882_08550 [Acidobacteria bacterium]|nr:hypothetical protein [Acidobacteriota bacterium]